MATGTEVLDVGRRDHVVLFYRDEQELTQPAACADQLDALTEVCHAHTQVTGILPDAD